MARRVCDACGARNDLTATVCTECGAALAGSRRPPRRADRVDGKGGLANGLLDLFPGFTSGRAMVWAGIMLLAALAMGLHAYSYMRLHVAPAALVAGVVAMGFYCTGMMWLLYGYVCVPLEAAVEFDGKRWLVLIGLALVPVVIVLALPGG